ncbi:MAG: hypothetical protein ABIE42_10205 [Candidatus Eisenbacteria bacterium]
MFSNLRHGRVSPVCPDLYFRDGRWWCALVEREPAYRHHLYIGEGCSSSLNTDCGDIPAPEDTP